MIFTVKRSVLLWGALLATLMLAIVGMAYLADPRPRSERHRDAIRFLIARGVISPTNHVVIVDLTFCGGALTGVYVYAYPRPGRDVDGRLCWDRSAKRWFAHKLAPADTLMKDR
jgi:hypothetical protein